MRVNKNDTTRYLGDDPDDDLPDLSTPYWQERIAKAEVQRGLSQVGKRDDPPRPHNGSDITSPHRPEDM